MKRGVVVPAKDLPTLDETIGVEEILVKEEAALAALPQEALATIIIIVEMVLVAGEEEKAPFQAASDPTPLVLEHLADDSVVSTTRLETRFLIAT